MHLRSFKAQVPARRFLNLYGPTETNVCTWYEIPRTIPKDRIEPYPIGRTCSHLQSMVVDEKGNRVSPGAKGSSCISGPNVMQGYWGRPDLTAKSFLPEDATGRRWYRTGDVVVELPDGNHRFVGRRDRMVKKRVTGWSLGKSRSVSTGTRSSKKLRLWQRSIRPPRYVIAHLSTRNGERLR